MRPTTLFSNHDEILQSAKATAVDDAVTRATEEPVPSASIGSRAFSMFNELPDDALRASKGFHMSAKLIVAIVAAGSFGAYVLAREAKTPASPVVIEQPASIEQVATPEAAPIVSEPAPAADAINEIAPVTTPAPAVKPLPVKRAVTSPKAAPKPWDMPAPAAATIVVAPRAPVVAPVTPIERAPETPVIPVVVPDAPVAPAPVVEAPAEPVPPAPVPVPVTPAPSPAPQEPAAPAPAN